MAVDPKWLSSGLLVAGAALGLGAAMLSALGVGDAVGRYDDAIAVVDGTPIPRSLYESAVEGLSSAKRNPLTDAERREVLDRVIDEELLLRRAVELGLGETDPTSRKALVNAILQFSIAEVGKRQPTEQELVAFYAERPKLIAPQPLLTVRAVSFPPRNESRVAQMQAAIKGGVAFAVAAKAAGADDVLLPNGPVIPAKIGEYAGGTIRDMALTLTRGQTAGPLDLGSRVVFVHLVGRTEAPPPPLADVRDVVVEEWQKREAEKAFADYVAGLRRRARISYATGAPVAGAK